MAPLMIPIEIISHLARPLSLTIRLFANMYAGEQVTLVFLSLTYLVAPAIFLGSARFCVAAAGLYLCAADDDVRGRRGGGRALILRLCRFPREASRPQARNATTSGRRFHNKEQQNETKVIFLAIALMLFAIPMFAQGLRRAAQAEVISGSR